MSLPHLLFFVLVNFIWGSMFVVAKVGLTEFPPVLFTAIRFGILAIVLFRYIRVPRAMIWPLVRVGLVMGVGMYLTLYYAIFLADNTAAVSVVSQLEVPMAVLLGVLLLGETFELNRVSGVVLSFAGALIIGFDPAMFDDLPAMFWMTVSAMFFAATMVMVRGMPKVHPLTITAWLSLVSSPILLCVSLIVENGHMAAIIGADWSGWGALLYTAFLGSVVAHSGMYYLLQRYPVGLLAPFTLLAPVFSVIGGVLILDNVLTARTIFGIALVLVGVAWINLKSRRPVIAEP